MMETTYSSKNAGLFGTHLFGVEFFNFYFSTFGGGTLKYFNGDLGILISKCFNYFNALSPPSLFP